MKKVAIVFGATGLTGSILLQEICQSNLYAEIKVFVRRAVKLNLLGVKVYEIDFDKIEEYAHLIKGDDLFWTLGTTIKDAGSKEKFEKVDFTFPEKIAGIALSNGIKHFLLMSSLGADAKSSNFYLCTKGKCENAIIRLGFECCSIFRPSMLLGKRKGFRLGEQIGKVVMQIVAFVFVGKLKRYKAIPAKTVAKAMIKMAQAFPTKQIQVYESDQIFEMEKN